MFHQTVSRFGLATHLAIAAALPAALAQFVSTGALAVSMLWMTLVAWVWILFEPSVLSGETVSRARARVLNHMLRDPLVWFLLFATVFSMVRWLNSGVAMFYDAEKTLWSVKEAAWTIAPASSGDSGFLPFATVAAASTVIIGIRHALGRNARVWFGVTAGSVSAIGGLAAVICAAMSIEPFRAAALAGFGESSFYGSFYALLLPVSIACGIEAEERGITKARLLLAFSVAGNAAGAFIFLPILLGAGYLAVSAVVAVMSLVLCKKRAGAAAPARAAAMLALGVVGAVSSVMVPSYKDIVHGKMQGLDPAKSFSMALTDRNAALQRVSVAMWKDYQWGGVGVGAYKLQAPFYVQNEDWGVLPPKPTHGSNGYLTLIAERGIIGALFWLVGLGFLLFIWCSRLWESIVWHRSHDEGRAWFFCIPSAAWAGVMVVIACLADAWFSSGFPLTALPVCVAASMTLAAGSFPRLSRKRDKEVKD